MDLSSDLRPSEPVEPTRFVAPDRGANLARRRRMTRRHFAAASLTTLTAAGVLGTAPALADDGAWRRQDPFTLGVASGDPTSSSVVLWTRLAVEIGRAHV